MKGSFLLLHALVAAVGSIPTRTDYVLHERRDAIPSHWTGEKRLDGQTMLPMRIGLTQSNLDRGHDLLMEVYASMPPILSNGANDLGPRPVPISTATT